MRITFFVILFSVYMMYHITYMLNPLPDQKKKKNTEENPNWKALADDE